MGETSSAGHWPSIKGAGCVVLYGVVGVSANIKNNPSLFELQQCRRKEVAGEQTHS